MTDQPASIEVGVMLVGVAGGLAMFLYGLRKLVESLKLVVGDKAKRVLGLLTANRFTAALAGAGITAVIQSSSITTVLVVSFITAGAMTFSQSIGVILGANLGTTVTAQIIAFKITSTALVLIAVGFFMEVMTRNRRLRQFAIMAMGLGMLFLGMELMSQATYPLRGYPPFMEFMAKLNSPLPAILVGALFTAAVQSSSATTGVVIIMASQGFVTLETGIALVMGSNIGTCVTVYVSAVGNPRAAMQAAMAHILFNVIGVLLFVFFIPELAVLVREISPVSGHASEIARMQADTPRQIANAHTVFNGFNLLLFLGFTQVLAKLVLRIVPDEPVVATRIIEPKYIDPYYLDQPALALDRARLEIVRMGEHVLSMIRDSLPVLNVGTEERIDTLEERDDEIDILHNEIIIYLHRLSSLDLLDPQPEQLYRYLTTANALENVGDVVKEGIVRDSKKRLAQSLDISQSTKEYIKTVYKEVYLAGQTTLQAIAEEDPDLAQQVLDSRPHFNGIQARARAHLYERLTKESPQHLSLYKIESNTIENFGRIYNLFSSVCELWSTDFKKVDSEQVAKAG